jgi:predicted metalloprotease with PDZ domain
MKSDAGRLLVENVPRGTPAYAGGVNPGDEILAIDDFRVLPDSLDTRLAAYRPGRKVVLLVSRRDELKRLEVTLGADPGDRWSLQPRLDATPQQRAHFTKWISFP